MQSMAMTGSRFYQAPPLGYSSANDEIKSYLKILKYFFVESAIGDFRKEELFSIFAFKK